MALPTNPSLNAQDAARRLDILAFTLYTEANAIKQDCIAGSVSLNTLVASRLQALINTLAEFNIERVKSGVDDAYGVRFSNKTFVYATEVLAVATAAQTFIDYIVTTIPIDAVSSRWLLVVEFDIDNTIIQRTVTGAGALSALQAQAQLLIDTFDIT